MAHTLALLFMADDVQRKSAAEVIAALADAGSFESWDRDPPIPADEDYAGTLRRAAEAAGTDESVITGRVVIDGRPAVVIVGEFSYLAGSAGMAAADRVVDAFMRATAERLPVIGAPTSGGTRMQEGTPAFLRMVAVAAAAAAHRAAGLAYLVWLRDPTTGGVMATWGSLGQVTAADRGALVGFLGPRVFQAMTGQRFPAGIQTAENLASVGVIDAVVEIEQLRDWVATALVVMTGQRGETGVLERRPAHHGPATVPRPDGWEAVTATRSADRPGLRELLEAAATDVTRLSGTTAGERDDTALVALARIGGTPCVLAGFDRVTGTAPGPGALRTVRRAIALAQELRLTLVTVVDTEGAEVSAAAEEGAMAGEIARSLADLAAADVPVVSVLLGSGCGGGALALLPADIVIAADDTWVTPLPPEGAAAILYRSTERAADVARSQRITAVELHELGAVDVVVPGVGRSHGSFIEGVAEAMADAVGRAEVTPTRISKFVVAGP